MVLACLFALFSTIEARLFFGVTGMDRAIDGDYMAHGYCLDWEKSLLLLHFVSDIVTGLTYYSIPVAMFYFAYKRRDLPLYKVFIMFAVFILACGTTHFLSAYTMFVPAYWLEGYVKAFTALVSVIAVVLFIPRLPEAIALPSLQAKINEVKSLNLELREKNAELQIANFSIQHVLDPIYWIGQDARIWKVNEAACRSLGYSEEEMLQLSIPDLSPAFPLERWAIHWEELKQQGSIRFETQNRTREGRLLEVEVSANLITYEGREFNCAVVRDITQRKEVEAEILQLNQTLEQRVADRTAQLEAANKDLEAFAYSISHDLRAPLRAINGYAHILIEDHAAQLDEEGLRKMGIVCKESKRMGQLIDGLLAFSRLGRQSIHFSRVDLQALAQGVFEECLGREPDRKIDFRLLPLPEAMGDPILLRQVVINLVSNAIKYSRPKALAEIEIGGRVEGDEQIYWVKDNGVGFDMNFAQKLFGVFQRMHSEAEFEGTGVGLAIVERVIQRHGGRVWAEAAVGAGTTIFFALPTGKE